MIVLIRARNLMKLRACITLAVCAFVCAVNMRCFVWASQDESFEEYYHQGLTAYQTGDYQSALDFFTQASLINPDNREVKAYLKVAGQKYLAVLNEKKAQERTEMLKEAQKIAIENKKKEDKFMQQGIQYYRNKQFLYAHKYFSDVLRINPQHKGAQQYRTRIRVYLEKVVTEGKFESLRELCYAQAMTAYLANDLTNAIDNWQKVLRLDEANPEVSEFIASAKSRIEERRKREEADILNKIALGYFDKKSYEDALKTWEKVTEIDSQYPKVKDNIDRTKALIERERKRIEQRTIETLVQRHWNKGLEYFVDGKFDLAKKEFETILRIDPSHTRAKERLDRTVRRIEEERISRNLVLSPYEQKVNELEQRGINLYVAKKFQESVAVWNMLLQIDPNNRNARQYRDKAMQMAGEQYTAGSAEEQPVVINEETQKLIEEQYVLGMIAFSNDDLMEAKKYFAVVLRMDPNHIKARRNIEKIDNIQQRTIQ